MGTVNIDLSSDTQLNMILGQQDETEVREVVFDFSDWYTTYGSGTISLSVQRSKDQWPYEVELTVDNTNHTATWTITDTDTGYAGVGMVQITYTVGTAKKKSVVYRFTVYRSLGATGNVITPVQLQTWMDEVDQELTDIKADLEELQNDAGVTAELKSALLQLASKVAYIDDDGQSYYDDLYDALYPNASSITCVYTQTGTVYTTDTLDSLKNDLVVTAHYSDSTTKVLKPSDYTLTGTLTAGTSTIVVHYGDLMTSFTVNVTARTVSSISAVYTQSGTVYSDDSTDSLKSDLVVTAIFNDSSSEILNNNDYSLSGSLDSATSTITVTYESKTTTFTVSVTLVGSTNYADDLANWKRSATATASYANGKITMKCSQSNANNWSMWVFDRAKTLWDTVNGKKLRIRITMDSPDWVGDISKTSPLNLVNVGVSIYKNATITSGSDRQKSQAFDSFVLDSTSQTFEYIFDADISNFNTGTGTPTNVSTFGVFVYDASANTVNITDCEIVEVLTT